MANPEHLAILKQGVAVWNEWRKTFAYLTPDLANADLRNQNLDGINFSRCILHSVGLFQSSLIKANLDGAELINAYLMGVDFTGASFMFTHLSGTKLLGAKLNGANLTGANLHGSYLSGADFSGAKLMWTSFDSVNLSDVIGLEKTSHVGPSTIGVDTIFKSNGNIPDIFLRGCGVPDIFIEYAHSLVGKPIQFYSCFISHSSKDKRFCERLYADLRAKHVRTWYFPEDAKWGESVWGEIDRSIKVYDKLVVVCSKNSLTSGPVLREIERALNREDNEGKQILFPIRIDDYLFDGWKHPRKNDVLAKVVGDFRGWNKSVAKYDEAFKKLVKALQA